MPFIPCSIKFRLRKKPTVHNEVPVWPFVFVEFKSVGVFLGVNDIPPVELPDEFGNTPPLVYVEVGILRTCVLLWVDRKGQHGHVAEVLNGGC